MSLAKVKVLAKSFGALVTDERMNEIHSCEVEAPRGHVWKGSGVHMLVDVTNRPWKPDYADLLNRMSYGIEPCTESNCEWCKQPADASATVGV